MSRYSEYLLCLEITAVVVYIISDKLELFIFLLVAFIPTRTKLSTSLLIFCTGYVVQFLQGSS